MAPSIAASIVCALFGAAEPATLPASLRDTGLYVDWERKKVDPRALHYAPQYPLWSDGAKKQRWLVLPKARAIDGSNPDGWKFPVGAKFFKEFAFDGRRIETRLIQRTKDGWLVGAYVWKADGSDAVLAPEGILDHVEIAQGVRYTIPSQTDCFACHEGHPAFILGFSALQLSPERDPHAPNQEPKTPDMVDLEALVARNLLRGFPPKQLSSPPKIEARTPTARAALGYLHGNCGNCHNGRGPLSRLGLNLWHEIEPPARVTPPAVRTTVGRMGDWRLPGEEQGAVRIVPGDPERSSVLVRMSSRQPLMQMPPLSTKLVDVKATALIAEWIRQLRRDEDSQPGRSQ